MSALVDSVSKIAGLASKVLEGYLVPGIDIAKSVIELIDNVKETVGTENEAALQVLRDELEPKVLAHADATEKALRG